MGAYLVRRIILIFPTLFGIMLINFAVIQIVPGGPVEQMIAQMTGTAVESTARFSGGGEGETLEFNRDNSTSVNDSKYRGAQGLDPDIIKEIEKMYGMDKPAHQRFMKMLKDYFEMQAARISQAETKEKTSHGNLRYSQFYRSEHSFLLCLFFRKEEER